MSIPFGVGLNEKVQADLLDPGQMATVQNLRINKTGSYEKRNGYTALAALGAAHRMGQFRGSPLVFDGTSLQNHASTGDYWINTGSVSNATATRAGILAAATMSGYYDMAYASGVIGIIYVKKISVTGGTPVDTLFISLVDSTTLATITTSLIDNATGTTERFKVRAVAIGTKLVFLYNLDTNNRLTRYTYDASTPLAAPTSATIASNIETRVSSDEIGFDACPVDATHFAVAYRGTASGTTLIVATYTTSGSSPAATVTLANSVTIESLGCGCRVGDVLWVAANHTHSGGVTKVHAIALNATTLATVSAFGTVLSLTGTAEPKTITIIPEATKRAVIAAGNSVDRDVVWDRMSGLTGTVTADATGGLIYRFAIMGKGFSVSSKYFLPIAVYDKDASVQTEPTGFLIELPVSAPARPVTTHLARLCDMDVASLWAPSTFTTSTTGMSLYPQKQEAAGTSLDMVTFDFAAPNLWQNNVAQASMPFTAGNPSQYDGAAPTEIGFLNAPGHIQLNEADATTGNLVKGTYSYTAIYEWVTASGELVQSAPCPIGLITIGTGPSNVDVYVPTMQLSYRLINATSEVVRILVYRTGPDGTTYNQVIQNGIGYNFAGDEFFHFKDTYADVSSNPLLYSQPLTPGAVLAKFCPPSASCMVVHRNRLFFVGDDGITIYYSGQFIDGEQPWFSDLFTLPVPKGGAITALESMDGILYVFKRDYIFSITGDGPVDNGSSNDFSTPEEIDIEVGCIEPRSIAISPGGIFYQSPKGIYLLSRARSSEYAGQNVETEITTYGTIVSATTSDANGCVYFEALTSDTTSTGVTIVYDYVHGQWMVDTKSDNATGAAIGSHGGEVINGIYYWCALSGQVNKEVVGSWIDSSRWVTAKIATPWIKVANIEGFARIWRTQLICANDTAGLYGLQVDAYRDYSGTSFQTWSWSASELNALVTARQQLQMDPSIQKVESLKLVFQDITPGEAIGTGKGPTWIGYMIECGVKAGLFKLPNANSK